MSSEKEIQLFLESLFNFKSSLYTRHFQQVIKKMEERKDQNKREEILFRAILDTASRFTIDLFDMVDHATKDCLKETEISQFWKFAKKIIENKMDIWLQENVQSFSPLSLQTAKLRSDIREFQERAVKFHMERQTYTFTLRKTKESEMPT